ncbi:MAG: hypothetical protein ACO2Y2_02120 [Poseidonia sp.]
MKRAPTDEPNLDDILARDFAELKVGEANIASTEPPKEAEQKAENPSLPKVYNQRIDAVEERTSFAVKPPNSAPSDEASKPTPPAPPEVLKSPSAQLGDDFDVDW